MEPAWLDRASALDERTHLAALDAAANSIIITNRDGRIEWVNAAFVKLTGYAREEVTGQTPRVLKSGKQDEGFYRALWDTVLEGKVWHGEMTNRRKDGTFYIQEATITPVRDEAGTIVRLVGVGQDVTERRDLETQLRQVQKMEAVGQLAGGIAHDFNNLLTTVLASAEMLRDQLPPASPLREDVEAIAKAGKRGAELTRNLLAFSRRQRLEMQVVDLTAVIAEFARMIRRVLREDLLLRVDLLEPVWVRADPAAVEQMLMNLATNARDAMSSGGTLAIEAGRVRLEAGSPILNHSASPGDYAMITVRDTGTGMSEETRRRLFEPFFTTKPVGAGTGLGMAMVYGLVKQHGGVVAVESVLGRGTTVLLYFPVAAVAGAKVASVSGAPAAGGGRETILIVEDEPAVRRVAERALVKHGYTVLGAGDGATALEAVLRGDTKVDLIMTDACMPGLSGAELYERLRAAGVRVPVLFTSGHSGRDALSTSLPEGVPFLGKPWTIPDLLAKVRETLGAASS
jgi:PAS domain S-box-containing protein